MTHPAYLLQFAGCAFAHLFIFSSWYALLARCAKEMASAVRLLLAMTLLWVQIVVTVLAFGLIGNLTRINVVFANLCLAAVITAVSVSAKGGVVRVRGIVASFHAILARIRSQPLVTLVVLAACLGFAWYATQAIFFPPFGYDDLTYHLPGAAFALQNGTLAPVVLPDRFSGVNYFPQATEFLSIWCFSLIGSDSMIGIWQCGIYLYFVTACFVLCRACGCGRASTLFAVSLAAVTPTLLAQLLTTYNDVFVAGFFASALAFAVIAGRDPSRTNLLALALSCGTLLAAKLSTPMLIVAVLAVFTAQHAIHRIALGRLARSIVFVLLVASALGGYWYVRNYLLYGNPIYPLRIQFAGLNLPGRIVPPHFLEDQLNAELSRLPLLKGLWKLWLEQKSHYGYWFYNYDSAYAGFGPGWFILGVPSILCAAALSLKKRRWVTLSVLCATVAVYLAFAGNISVRYTLFVLPAMVLGIAATIDQLQVTRQERFNKVHSFVARWILLAVRSLGALLAVFTLGLMTFALRDPERARKQIFTSTIAKTDVDATIVGAFGPVRAFLSADTVVIFDENVEYIYPLWRTDFKNKVYYVSTAQPMDNWLAAVLTLKAQYVFTKARPTTRNGKRQSALPEWIALNPARFKLLATLPNLGELYELL